MTSTGNGKYGRIPIRDHLTFNKPVVADHQDEWQRALEQTAINSSCVCADLDAELKRLGLPEVGNDPGKWEHLARVTEQDPARLTLDEIYRGALAWVDREKLRLKLAYEFSQTQSTQVLSSDGTSDNSRGNSQTKKSFRFVGDDHWENWGVGADKNETWHLFHFNRLNGHWTRHRHLVMTIPAGIPDGLARKFLRFGFITLDDAHEVLRKHAKVAVDEKIRKPMSFLGRRVQ